MKLTIFLIIIFCIAVSETVIAQHWEESYDPNTEITIKGKITDILQRERGVVALGVLKNARIYRIITAPVWYLDEEKIDFSIGDEVIVSGAKFFSRSGELLIISRSIQNISKGKMYYFRDEFMKPQWRRKGGIRRFNPQ